MKKKKYDLPHEIDLKKDNPAFDQDEIDAGSAGDKTKVGTQNNITVQKTVGLVGGISLIVGTMIGSGIFASASTVANNSGSVGLALVIWSASGLIAMFGALCYIELGLMIPVSGGEYSYLLEAFGELPAFLFVYTSNILLKPASTAAIVVAAGDYIVEPFFGMDCKSTDKVICSKLFSAFFLGLIVFVNCASTRLATRVQVVFTFAKLFAISLISGTGFVRLGQGYSRNFKSSFDGTNTGISGIGYAFYGGLWAYDGWNNLNYVTGEMINPVRDLPLSIMIGLPLVTCCYVLINIAYLTVMSPIEIATSSAVAVIFGERMYGVMAWIVPVLVACSTFGAANGVAFTGGRLVFVSARNGHMPKLLAMIHNKRNTPLPALVFTCIISWIMILPDSSNFEALINYFSFAAWIFYGVTFLSLIWLRYKRPDLKRPYKIFIAIPVIMVLVSIYLVVAPFADYPIESTYCLLFVLSGIPVYLALVKYPIVPKCLLDLYDKFSFKLEALMGVVLPESEDLLSD